MNKSLLNSLFLIICMVIYPLAVIAQTTETIDKGTVISSQTGARSLNASDIPGSHSIQSYVDHINPSALAAQLAPMFSLLGAALVTLSGLVLMLQAKRTAVRMFVTGIGCVVIGSVPGLLVPVFILIKSMPVWLTMIIAFFMSLALLGAFAAIFIGRAAAAVMIGSLAAWVIQRILLLLILPFSALRRVINRDDQ